MIGNDCHIHIVPIAEIRSEFAEIILSSMKFPRELYLEICRSPAKLVEVLDECSIEKVAIMSYPSPETHGLGMELVDFVIDYCSEFRDRLYPVGSVHPRLMSEREIEESLQQQYSRGIAAIKLHPVHQHFKPNDYREEEKGLRGLEAVYEFASAHNIAVMIHTGTSVLPNARVKFGDPIFLDDVAVDFPKLKIVMCHGGRPFWTQKAFFLMRRFKNVWFDISGIPPQRLLEYFPRFKLIADRCVYGSDLPSPGVKGLKENLEEFLKLPLDESVKRRIVRDNFTKIFTN